MYVDEHKSRNKWWKWMELCFQGKFTILDSLVNALALAVSNNVLPAKTV